MTFITTIKTQKSRFRLLKDLFDSENFSRPRIPHYSETSSCERNLFYQSLIIKNEAKNRPFCLENCFSLLKFRLFLFYGKNEKTQFLHTSQRGSVDHLDQNCSLMKLPPSLISPLYTQQIRTSCVHLYPDYELVDS